MVTNEGRAKMRHLGRGVRVVADLGRPYRCIYHRRGYYTCEDWLAFTETYSLLLLRHNDILEPQVALPLLCTPRPAVAHLASCTCRPHAGMRCCAVA